MKQFLTKVFQTPKGILFCGPPGTGKSAISSALCSKANFVFAAPPMAAGDFSKGVVGDSERMVNAIA